MSCPSLTLSLAPTPAMTFYALSCISGAGGGGISQGQLDSLSGFTVGVSGSLQAQIAAGGSQVRVSGSSTLAIADFSGLGGTQVLISGGRVFISGGSSAGGGVTQAQLDSLSGWAASAANLGLSGSILFNDITGLSGQAASTYATVLNLALTGQQAFGLFTGLSGALYQTGSNLFNLITGLSGAHNLLIAQTGQAAWTSANGAAATLSGLLTLSGQTLLTAIAATGQASWTWANGAATILSGNMTQSGLVLLARTMLASGWLQTGLDSLSGFSVAMSGALQALIVGGGGTVVKVTGGAALATADFTGIGGTLVFTSGGKVFISGSAGGGAGGVPSVNGITSAVTVAGTGGLGVATIGSTIYVSGDQSISGVVALTGANLYAMLVAESGALATVPFKFGLSLDAGTGIVVSGLKGAFQLSAGMRISGWNIAAYQTGILQVDINRSTLATFPAFASIITGGANYPYISGTLTGSSVNLSGWSGVLLAGDYLEFLVRGCTGVSKFTINITGIKA